MARTKELDMLNGALLPKLMMFSLPLALTGILQLLFNAADVIVVGKFAGSTSLAAVGATSALINLLTGAFIGISVGVNILVARYIGCRDDAGVSRAVHSAVTLSLLLGVVTFLLGFFLSTPMLELMGTPDDVLRLASLYLRIYFIGIPGALIYNFAAAILRAGGVVVMPTDSVYGIAAAATPSNPGHRRIFDIKRRDLAQTLPLLVSDASELDRPAIDVPSWARSLVERLWPGALTLVVRASEAVPPDYQRENGTVALRVPDSALVRELAREVGPLAVTSANTHGMPAPATSADIERRIAESADLTLAAGPTPAGAASTIVDTTSGEPRIVRQGPIPAEAIAALAR